MERRDFLQTKAAVDSNLTRNTQSLIYFTRYLEFRSC